MPNYSETLSTSVLKKAYEAAANSILMNLREAAKTKQSNVFLQSSLSQTVDMSDFDPSTPKITIDLNSGNAKKTDAQPDAELLKGWQDLLKPAPRAAAAIDEANPDRITISFSPIRNNQSDRSKALAHQANISELDRAAENISINIAGPDDGGDSLRNKAIRTKTKPTLSR